MDFHSSCMSGMLRCCATGRVFAGQPTSGRHSRLRQGRGLPVGGGVFTLKSTHNFRVMYPVVSRRVQVVCAILVVGLLIGGTGIAVVVFERVPAVGHLTRDATAVAGVPWWTGAVSRLTSLCWAVAATANILAARGSARSLRGPLLSLGLLCVALGIDDTMLVHEAVMPRFGVPSSLILGIYALAALALAWAWLRTSGDIWVRSAFFVGGTMLAVSFVVDVVVHGLMGLEDSSLLLLIEDGAKLAGVTAWCFVGAWAHRSGCRN